MLSRHSMNILEIRFRTFHGVREAVDVDSQHSPMMDEEVAMVAVQTDLVQETVPEETKVPSFMEGTIGHAILVVRDLFVGRYNDIQEGTYPVTLAYETRDGFHPVPAAKLEDQIRHWCLHHRKNPHDLVDGSICVHFWIPVACVLYHRDGTIKEFIDAFNPHWRIPKS